MDWGQEMTSKIESRILTWGDVTLEVEKLRLQISPGLMSFANRVAFPKTQL